MAPPPYLEAMATSRPYDEVHGSAPAYSATQQGGARGRRSRRNRRRSDWRGSRDPGGGPGASLATPSDGEVMDDDVPLIDAEGGQLRTNTQRPDSPLLVVPPVDESSEEEEFENDDVTRRLSATEQSNVSLSMAAGISAQWRRSPQKSRCATSDLHGEEGANSPATATSQSEDVTSIDSASVSTDSVLITLSEDASPKMSSANQAAPVHQPVGVTTPARTTSGATTLTREEYTPALHVGSDGEDSLVSVELQDESAPLQ